MWTDFVDAIFVVNLPERKDRWMYINDTLKKLHINFITWSAIKNEDGKKGLRETMKLLFLHCVSAGYKRVCILEDDVVFLRSNTHELLDKCIEQLPKDFHLFYMGGNVWKQPVRKSPNILQAPCIYSTQSIIYSKEAIEYILPLLDEESPYDVILVNSIQKLNKTYCSFPILTSQKTGYSDIEKKVVNYEKYIEKRFDEKTRRL